MAGAVAETPGAVGLILFGSYARGEFGRKSDVDLLFLLADLSLRRQFISLAGELESQHQLPMHLAPIFAEPSHPETLGPTLLHDLWTDGVILYGIAADLALLRPGVLLLPPTDVGKVKDALVEFGATYDAFPVWRSI